MNYAKQDHEMNYDLIETMEFFKAPNLNVTPIISYIDIEEQTIPFSTKTPEMNTIYIDVNQNQNQYNLKKTLNNQKNKKKLKNTCQKKHMSKKIKNIQAHLSKKI